MLSSFEYGIIINGNIYYTKDQKPSNIVYPNMLLNKCSLLIATSL